MMTTNILSYLKRAAQTAPDHCALADASREYTYAQTWRIACALGAELSRLLGGARRRPVLVAIDRSPAARAAARVWSRSTGAQEFPLLFTA